MDERKIHDQPRRVSYGGEACPPSACSVSLGLSLQRALFLPPSAVPLLFGRFHMTGRSASQVATAFVDGRLPKPSSLLLSGSGGGRGGGYTPGPAILVQVQPESNAARGGGGATGGSDASGGGGDGGEPGKGGAAHSSTLARRGRAGSGSKENQERRAKLLADLGDGTVLVSWANTGVEEVINSRSLPAVCRQRASTDNGEVVSRLKGPFRLKMHSIPTTKPWCLPCWLPHRPPLRSPFGGFVVASLPWHGLPTTPLKYPNTPLPPSPAISPLLTRSPRFRPLPTFLSSDRCFAADPAVVFQLPHLESKALPGPQLAVPHDDVPRGGHRERRQ